VRLETRLVTGRGEAARFTSLAWVREQFRESLGVDPSPGTLNVVPVADRDRRAWQTVRSRPGTPITPPDPAWCAARGYRVRVGGRLPAAIVVPEVPEYPPDQIEIVASVPLREALGLQDGDVLQVEPWAPLPVSAVIFDVDGTLVDSLMAFRVVAEQAAAPHGFAITDAIVREALNGGRSFWELIVPDGYEGRAQLLASLSAEAARNWPAVLQAHGRVLPHVSATLDVLRSQGARLGIVTGAQRESLAPLRAADLLDHFDIVVTKDDVRRRKPHPEGLLACAAALDVDPVAAVYVGDTPLDVEAARAAGMWSVGVLTGAGDARLLSGCGPDHLVATLAALPGVLNVRSTPTG
jgi:HAD superfamily hydrolase (TIGR01509 family)